MVTINANGSGSDKDNMTIDAGYLPCLNSLNGIITNVSCNGFSDGAIALTPIVNKGYVTYLWNDGSTTKNRTGIIADTFAVTATDSMGCIITGSYITTQPIKPVINPIAGLDSLCLDSVVLYTDATLKGYWLSSDTTILQIDSILGSTSAIAVGNATVTYSVVSSNCIYSQSLPVVVTDCESGVNSGIDGGVESKSLGNIIAQRAYNKAINSIGNEVDYSKLPLVASIPSIATMGSSGFLSLKDLLPSSTCVSSVLTASVNVYTTSPTDLVNFTNALEVQAQDYNKNSICKAVALATKTSGMVYSHTKPICDRLRSAQILDITTVNSNNISLIQYKLLQDDGNTEYAVSFSAGRNSNTNLYNIQSIWLTENFMGYDTMYNFQLWSSSSTILKNMISNVLQNLSANLPLSQLTSAVAPSSYIVYHNRNGKQLDLKIRNNSSNSAFNLQMNINTTELSTSSMVKTIPITINPFADTVISVNMNDSYEADVKLIANNDIDLIYSNDGTWSISYDNATTINQFNISNDTLTPQIDEWRLFRNITINATSSDYVSIYKLLRPAAMPKDITAFKGLKFIASCSGAGTIRITLVKSSITDWNSQYFIDIPVQNGTKEYILSMSDFAALGVHDLNANDITTINFAFEVNTGMQSNINATLTNVRFTKYDAAYLNSLTSKKISISPNPSNGSFICTVMSDKAGTYTLRMVNISTGVTAASQMVQLAVGENKIPINFSGLYNEKALYVIKLEGINGEIYSPTKIVILK